MAAAARNQIKITAIKAMQLDEEKSTLIKSGGHLSHSGLPAQRQRPGAYHGFAAVVGGGVQLPTHGVYEPR